MAKIKHELDSKPTTHTYDYIHVAQLKITHTLIIIFQNRYMYM